MYFKKDRRFISQHEARLTAGLPSNRALIKRLNDPYCELSDKEKASYCSAIHKY